LCCDSGLPVAVRTGVVDLIKGELYIVNPRSECQIKP
jgi:hypothetical protein